MNFVKTKVVKEETYGLFIASGAASPTEIAARSGFDWLLLDMEHGLGGEQETLRQISLVNATPCAPLVRIPALRPEIIKRVLDFGAAGIMCPMLEDAGQAEQLVRAMRYPPEGIRGMTSNSVAAEYGFSFKDYFKTVNESLLCIAQIENASAVANIEAIAAVPGIDVLFIGHSDLSLNLGVYGKFDSPEMVQAERAVVGAAAKYGKTAGMLLKDTMDPNEYRQKGFRFLALGTDHGCLKQAYRSLLKRAVPRTPWARDVVR